MSSSARESAEARQARRDRRQSNRGQYDNTLLDPHGYPTDTGNPTAAGNYQTDPYFSTRQAEYYARTDTRQALEYAQSRSSHTGVSHQTQSLSSPHLAEHGYGNIAQGQSSVPSHYSASIGPVQLSVPSYQHHQHARSHTPTPLRHGSSTQALQYPVQGYPPSAPSTPAPVHTHEHQQSRHRDIAQPVSMRPASSLKRAYDDHSRSATPASMSHYEGSSVRTSSQSSPAVSPSPSPSMGTVELGRSGTSRGKQSSSSASRRSKSRVKEKSSSASGASGSRSRANPPGVHTFSVTPSPATQFAPSGAMYMGAVDLQSNTAATTIDHGPTELPPRQYVGGSDAVSPWAPKKNLGTIPGSAMDHLPALEDRLSRLELNLEKYVEYRGKKAVKNAIAPDLKKKDSE